MTQLLNDEVLRALAHTERRRLLRMCSGVAVTAGDLAKDAGMSAASVSEHLKVLRKTGLAQVEKRGKFWLYKADLASLRLVLTELHEDLLKGNRDDKEK